MTSTLLPQGPCRPARMIKEIHAVHMHDDKLSHPTQNHHQHNKQRMLAALEGFLLHGYKDTAYYDHCTTNSELHFNVK